MIVIGSATVIVDIDTVDGDDGGAYRTVMLFGRCEFPECEYGEIVVIIFYGRGRRGVLL